MEKTHENIPIDNFIKCLCKKTTFNDLQFSNDKASITI